MSIAALINAPGEKEYSEADWKAGMLSKILPAEEHGSDDDEDTAPLCLLPPLKGQINALALTKRMVDESLQQRVIDNFFQKIFVYTCSEWPSPK